MPKSTHPTTDYLAIESLLKDGVSPQLLRRAFPHISRTNIYSKASRFRETGSSLPNSSAYKTLGRPRKISPELEKLVKELVTQNPDMELKDVAKVLEERAGVKISASGVSRVVTRITGGEGRGHGLRSKRLGVKKKAREEATARGENGGAAERASGSSTQLGVGDSNGEELDQGRGQLEDQSQCDDERLQLALDPALAGDATERGEAQQPGPGTYPLPDPSGLLAVEAAYLNLRSFPDSVYQTPYLPVQMPRESA